MKNLWNFQIFIWKSYEHFRRFIVEWTYKSLSHIMLSTRILNFQQWNNGMFNPRKTVLYKKQASTPRICIIIHHLLSESRTIFLKFGIQIRNQRKELNGELIHCIEWHCFRSLVITHSMNKFLLLNLHKL